MTKVRGSVKAAKKLFVGMMLGANLCTLLMLWGCVLSTYISPAEFPKISLIGLAFPIFLVINLVFCVLWAIFHIRLIWVPLVGMLLIYSFILDYCPLNRSEIPTDDSILSVISFNAGWMREDEQKDAFAEYVIHMSPDILCIQELGGSWVNRADIRQWRDSLGYTEVTSGSNTIFSRLPILGDTISVPYPTRTNQSFACWLDYEGDSLLLINNHLESNHLSEDETAEYQLVIKNPEKNRLEQSGHLIGRKLVEAARYRGSQTDTLCAIIQRNADKRIIMCGDNNDTPISYTYQRLSGHLKEAFREGGFGPGFSFNLSGFYIRIDHIFYSDDLECEYSFIDRNLEASDHYPIVTYLSKKHK